MRKEFRFEEKRIFAVHDKETISRWVNGLKFFTFLRATGGHANDADQFLLALQYDREKHLLQLLYDLGFDKKPDEETLIRIREKNVGPYMQIGRTSAGVFDWFLFLQNDQLMISPVNCGGYETCEKDFEACVFLENLVLGKGFASQVSEEPGKRSTAITVEKYPQLKKESGV